MKNWVYQLLLAPAAKNRSLSILLIVMGLVFIAMGFLFRGTDAVASRTGFILTGSGSIFISASDFVRQRSLLLVILFRIAGFLLLLLAIVAIVWLFISG